MCKHYTVSADLNNPMACYAFGHFYENGIHYKKDIKEAIKWYKRSADLGDDIAVNRLKILLK